MNFGKRKGLTTNQATRPFWVFAGSGIDVGKEEFRMPTKKQHFVPRVYMKAWETQVETLKEPEKKFNGIYVIKDGSIGDGANRNSVLWKPALNDDISIRIEFTQSSKKLLQQHTVRDDFFHRLATVGHIVAEGAIAI